MAGAKGPGRALAMNKEFPPLSVDDVHLDLTRIVRDIEKQAQVAIRKEMSEDAPRAVTEDFAVGERAIGAARIAPR
jgi:hypothetical protein